MNAPAPRKRRLVITTTVAATVTEQWSYDVPADLDLADDADTMLGFLNGSITPPDCSLIGVENVEVTDEIDRAYKSREFLS